MEKPTVRIKAESLSIAQLIYIFGYKTNNLR